MSQQDERSPAEVDMPLTRPLGTETVGDPSVHAIADSTRVGQRFGRFEILDVLGAGGMGTVFEARDCTLDRAVALKLLHPDLTSRSERRLLREAQALAKLSHPNVVQIFEAGVTEGRPFIAMELLRGETLAQWQTSRHTWRECLEVYLHAGHGLAAAHARGLLHRDFKPSNCIIDAAARVRVLDFGLARPIDAEFVNEARLSRVSSDSYMPTSRRGIGILSQDRGAPGTLGYMPLEQLWGQPLDAKSDQFSFCVSLFEAVYGRRPFSGESIDALVAAMLDGELDIPPHAPKVPARLQRMLVRGLLARPAARWPAMDDVLHEIELLLLPPHRSRGRWALGIVGSGLAITGAAWWGTREPPCEDPQRELDRAWSAQSREEVVEALGRTKNPLPPDLLPRLDAYAAQWASAQEATCVAARDPLTDESITAVRRKCLAEALDALGETAVLLGQGKDELLALATTWLHELPELERCRDTERFASQRPLPDDPELAERVRALRLQRATAQASHHAGDQDRALEILGPAVAEATTLDFPPLLAELELMRGTVWTEHGRYDAAEHALEQAYTLAVEHEQPHIALRAAVALAYVEGDLREHHDVGFKWGLTAEALARQPWSNPARLAGVMEIMGNVLYEQGRYAEAYDRYGEALETRDAVEPDSPIESMTLSNMALVLYEQGRYEDALPLTYRVLERRRTELDAQHPAIAVSLISLGSTLHQLGHYAQAKACYQEALEIREQTLGPTHPGVVIVLNELGRLFMDTGEPARALDAYQRALTIGAGSLEPTHSHLAEAWIGLGRVLRAHGQPDAALRHVAHGERMLEQSVGPRHVHVGTALIALGELQLQLGERRSAREHLERAVEILTHAEGPPAHLAAARFALAQLLWSYTGERSGAIGLAEQAHRTYREAGEPTRAEAQRVQAWLTAHGEESP